MRYRTWLVVAVTAAVVAVTACTGADAGDSDAAGRSDGPDAERATSSTPPPTTPAYRSEIYADAANWLCRPELTDDACDIDLDATLVAADGTTTVQPFVPAEDPAADCFYVYPTISGDPPPNADLSPGPEEQRVVAAQFARFGELCRTFAPVYRQVPLAGLTSLTGAPSSTTTTAGSATTTPLPGSPGAVAYGDVLDAWRHYLANDNDGRPVVLIGHSQGAGHLRRLIAEEIDRNQPVRDRLVSALLIGSAVAAPGTAGAFAEVPPCEAPPGSWIDADPTPTGCVVSYASFAADGPPPDNSLFGAPRQGDGRVVCVNPAATTGPAPLDAYFAASQVGNPPGLATPWVRYQGLVSGECVRDGRFDHLRVTNEHTPGDARPGDLGGRITPPWGLHLIDVQLAQGDLIELVRRQIDAS